MRCHSRELNHLFSWKDEAEIIAGFSATNEFWEGNDTFLHSQLDAIMPLYGMYSIHNPVEAES